MVDQPGRVIVVGSLNMDVVATVSSLPTPGETVAGSGVAYLPGGKGANQAVAAARAGAPTSLIGRVGDDRHGAELVGFLAEAAVDVSSVERLDGVATGTAVVTVDADGENTVVVSTGANGRLRPPDVSGLRCGASDVMVVQLEVPVETVAAAVSAGRDAGATVVANLAPAGEVPDDLFDGADVLVVNRTELSTYSGGLPSNDQADVAAACQRLIRREGQVVIVTLGSDGALCVGPDGGVATHSAPPVDAVDTTGAGDCFVGSLAARLVAGDRLDGAIRYAVAASALCVQRAGAGPSMPSRSEVESAGF